MEMEYKLNRTGTMEPKERARSAKDKREEEHSPRKSLMLHKNDTRGNTGAKTKKPPWTIYHSQRLRKTISHKNKLHQKRIIIKTHTKSYKKICKIQ